MKITRAASDSKKKWEKLLKDPKSKDIIMKKVWTSKNPQEEYKKIIKEFAKKIDK